MFQFVSTVFSRSADLLSALSVEGFSVFSVLVAICAFCIIVDRLI